MEPSVPLPVLLLTSCNYELMYCKNSLVFTLINLSFLNLHDLIILVNQVANTISRLLVA